MFDIGSIPANSTSNLLICLDLIFLCFFPSVSKALLKSLLPRTMVCSTFRSLRYDLRLCLALAVVTKDNQLGSGFSTVPTVYNGEEKPASFFTPDGLRRYAR